MGTLEGKIAWITGGGTGIGRSGAGALAEAGAKVWVSGRRREQLDAVVDVIRSAGGKAAAAVLDVADAGAAAAVAGSILDEDGALDILVNGAGVNAPNRYFRDLTPEAWDRVMTINVNGAFHCIQAVLPSMRARGGG